MNEMVNKIYGFSVNYSVVILHVVTDGMLKVKCLKLTFIEIVVIENETPSYKGIDN